MTVRVRGPDDFRAARRWIVESTLGPDCEFVAERRSDWCIESIFGTDGAVFLPDAFFASVRGSWLEAATVPAAPLPKWSVDSGLTVDRLVAPELPVLFGSAGIKRDGDVVWLGLDVFGSAFFLLSRYEEQAITDRDQHGRFPATASLAVRAGYIDRPLADEYVEILRAAIESVCPGAAPPSPESRTVISCDVDNPYERYVTSAPDFVRRLGGDVVKRRSAREFMRTLTNGLASRVGIHRFDQLDTFDWIMDQNERTGHRVEFYFLVANTDARWDSYYRIDEPRIRALLRRIHARGHTIGLHGSYGSAGDAAQIRRELTRLQEVLNEEGIRQPSIGLRQHYLRWEPGTSVGALAGAGVDHDSTIAFAECPGFRAGTCRPFRLFDLSAQEATAVEERPLVMMESSLLTDVYGPRHADADVSATIAGLHAATRRVGGDFRMLWHNDSLVLPGHRAVYLEAIAR